MATDREQLALYETPEALARKDWPEWEARRGRRRWRESLQYDPPRGRGQRGVWYIRWQDGAGDWRMGTRADDHTALCILERDGRLKLEKRGVSVELYSGLYVVRKGLSHLLTNGKWRLAVRRSADVFGTYTEALLAGLAATEQGASK